MATLYIIRGLPGSGKSTLAMKLVHSYRHMEADMFFIDDEGKYNYNVSDIKQAHEWCFNKVKTMMLTNKYYNCAVSNTFTRRWEYQKYMDLAKEYSFNVVIIETHANFGNKHNVPEKVIQSMKDRWEPHKD